MTDVMNGLVSEAKNNKYSSIRPTLSDDDVVSVWENVSTFIEKQMALQKGVNIPGLGTFTFIQKKLDVGNNKYILIQRPVFLLSEKFAQTHQVNYTKHHVTGQIPVVQLNYAALSYESPFDRDTVESCVKEVLQALARSVGSRRNVEFTFQGIGRLQIRDSKVKMKFYKEFLNSMDGSGQLVNALKDRPGTVDSVMSEGRTPTRAGTSNTLILPRINQGAGGLLPEEPKGLAMPTICENEEAGGEALLDGVDEPANESVPEGPDGDKIQLTGDAECEQEEKKASGVAGSRTGSRMTVPLAQASGISFHDDLLPPALHSPKGVRGNSVMSARSGPTPMMLKRSLSPINGDDFNAVTEVVPKVHWAKQLTRSHSSALDWGTKLDYLSHPLDSISLDCVDVSASEHVAGVVPDCVNVEQELFQCPEPPVLPKPKFNTYQHAPRTITSFKHNAPVPFHSVTTPPDSSRPDFPRARSVDAAGSLLKKPEPLFKIPTPPKERRTESACGHENAGQELCYLCHQREGRNVPVSFTEERKRREREEDRLLQQYQHMKDTEAILNDHETILAKRHESQKMAAFNLGVSDAISSKKRSRDVNFHTSYIFQKRPLTPPRFFKQQKYFTDLQGQVTLKSDTTKKRRSDEEFLERLEQVQLAEDLAMQRDQYLHEKNDQTEQYKRALSAQVRFKPLPIPARVPDSTEPVFGKADMNAEKMADRRRVAHGLYKEQLATVEQRKRDAILRQLAEQKEAEEMLKRTKHELKEDRADKYERLFKHRKRLESDWASATLYKKDREHDERMRMQSPGMLVHEQCDKYKRCDQCKRTVHNCGESNIWRESRYIPGSRLMV